MTDGSGCLGPDGILWLGISEMKRAGDEAGGDTCRDRRT